MAMSRTSWSVNGLATEFGLDRRTVAKRLESVIPVDLGPDGSPRWSMMDAGPALLAPREPRSGSRRPPPAGAEILTKIPNDVQAGYATAWLEIAVNIKPLVASALMMSGLPLPQAQKATTHVYAFLMRYADKTMREIGIPPWQQQEAPDWVPMDKVQEPNWQGLAAFAKQQQAPAARRIS